jgi:hypothetical protein
VLPLWIIKEKMVSIEDLINLSVVRLKAFLKERNIPANGTKSELLQLARLYYNRPVLRMDQELDQRGKDGLFDCPELQWNVVTSDTRIQVCKIDKYLTTSIIASD